MVFTESLLVCQNNFQAFENDSTKNIYLMDLNVVSFVSYQNTEVCQ